MHFTVLGTPRALQRHRFTKKGFTYDPSVQDKKAFAIQAAVFKPGKPIEGAIKLTLGFFFSHPKSHYRTGKYSHILKDNFSKNRFMDKKPDLDNLIKLVADSLPGFYRDDRQIVIINARKLYCADGDEPRTVVGIQIL